MCTNFNRLEIMAAVFKLEHDIHLMLREAVCKYHSTHATLLPISFLILLIIYSLEHTTHVCC